MRVVVCGSSRWKDIGRIRTVLRNLEPGSVIVRRAETHGADTMCEAEAREIGLAVEAIATEPHRFGHKADLERDRVMLEDADHLVAFRTGGVSLSTDRLIWLAAKKGIDVTVHHMQSRQLLDTAAR